MIRKMIAIVVVVSFAAAVQAGVTLDVTVYGNSIGQDVYIITATSNADTITALGLNATSPTGELGQVHPMGFETPLQHYNVFMDPPIAMAHDTQGMFSPADQLLVVSGSLDSIYELDVNFTGFTPFQSRDVLQVVLQSGSMGYATIGVVAGGVEYTLDPQTTYGPNGSLLNWVPEPASMALLAVGGLAMIRRR